MSDRTPGHDAGCSTAGDSAEAGRYRVELVRPVIDEPYWVDWVTCPHAGAVLTFRGVVRDHHRGRAVKRLDYSAYEPMAMIQMQHLADEILARWSLDRLAIVHRLGVLEISEASVFIALSLAHRADGFPALQYAIDRFKEIVPIWKKETFADGVSEWVHQSS